MRAALRQRLRGVHLVIYDLPVCGSRVLPEAPTTRLASETTCRGCRRRLEASAELREAAAAAARREWRVL